MLKQSLGNQHIPQLMELNGLFKDGTTNQLALVLKYMSLGSLHDMFTSCNRRCTVPQVKHIAREVLLGLRTLHGFSSPILHCDIKPENVLIDSCGSVKIGDYGLLKRLSDKNVHVSEQRGTQKYFSPERINGRYSLPADIWAVGVTLVECLLGKVIDPKELSSIRVSSGDISPVDFLTRKEHLFNSTLVDFLKRSLDPEPEKRWCAARLVGHKFLCSPAQEAMAIFKVQPKNKALLDELLSILIKFIGSRADCQSLMDNVGRTHSEDLLCSSKRRISHKERLYNIMRWTGFSRREIEQHVHELYLKLMGSPSSYKHHYNSKLRAYSQTECVGFPDLY